MGIFDEIRKRLALQYEKTIELIFGEPEYEDIEFEKPQTFVDDFDYSRFEYDDDGVLIEHRGQTRIPIVDRPEYSVQEDPFEFPVEPTGLTMEWDVSYDGKKFGTVIATK
tara:strand:+ start:603 stop:932 length:330 start_codon:yes stop_codon:yes gene_type:complete